MVSEEGANPTTEGGSKAKVLEQMDKAVDMKIVVKTLYVKQNEGHDMA